MSRIGKQPVAIPSGVTVTTKGRQVDVKGPNGNLSMEHRPEIDVEVKDNQVHCTPNGSGAARQSRAFHGMTRALINNMVNGVAKGFEKKLEIIGVGWNAAAQTRSAKIQTMVRISRCNISTQRAYG